MINLLPKNAKNEINAARLNIVLVNYFIFLILAITFLAISCTSIYLLLNDMKKTANDSLAINQIASSKVSMNGDIGATIATAQSILNRKINYSDVVISIGQSLPYGVVVDKISLNDSLLYSPLTIEFRAKSARVTSELLANLNKQSMFANISAKPSIVSTGNSPDYPVLITCTMNIVRASTV